ncbi:hypothetical protein MLD38_002066 [Melastoma candidum]|uniref:Uncharacterized protein n=1 Tax=Melastoma candidum TaxID=119954 RepID=A0ACB9SEL9_9MYRT|nr:hypothetical protein MLD38_002066 [Melastoma candidum]
MQSFPDNNGLELPHQAKLAVGDNPLFNEWKYLLSYKWAQHLAGIVFLPEVSPFLAGHDNPRGEITRSIDAANVHSMHCLQNRVPTILERVQTRVKARPALVWDILYVVSTELFSLLRLLLMMA